ncbi:MAG: hypothetical protein RL748_1888, partial [Pseudomonadota bacterium]
MAGHSLLNQIRSKSEALTIGGEIYNIVLTYNKAGQSHQIAIG